MSKLIRWVSIAGLFSVISIHSSPHGIWQQATNLSWQYTNRICPLSWLQHNTLLLRFLGLRIATTILGTGPTLTFHFDKQNTVNDSTSSMPDPYCGKIFPFFPQTKTEGLFHFIGAHPLSQGSLPVSQTWHLDKGSKVQSEFGTGPLDRAHAVKVVGRDHFKHS